MLYNLAKSKIYQIEKKPSGFKVNQKFLFLPWSSRVCVLLPACGSVCSRLRMSGLAGFRRPESQSRAPPVSTLLHTCWEPKRWVRGREEWWCGSGWGAASGLMLSVTPLLVFSPYERVYRAKYVCHSLWFIIHNFAETWLNLTFE